jgi:hypothetical protein
MACQAPARPSEHRVGRDRPSGSTQQPSTPRCGAAVLPARRGQPTPRTADAKDSRRRRQPTRCAPPQRPTRRLTAHQELTPSELAPRPPRRAPKRSSRARRGARCAAVSRGRHGSSRASVPRLSPAAWRGAGADTDTAQLRRLRKLRALVAAPRTHPCLPTATCAMLELRAATRRQTREADAWRVAPGGPGASHRIRRRLRRVAGRLGHVCTARASRLHRLHLPDRGGGAGAKAQCRSALQRRRRPHRDRARHCGRRQRHLTTRAPPGAPPPLRHCWRLSTSPFMDHYFFW